MDTPFDHKPVLLNSVLKLLNPTPGDVFCDATLGGGGHAEQILEMTAPDGRLVGIDRDSDALEAAAKRLARFGDRVSIHHGKFSDIEQLLDDADVHSLNGLLLDLGVSSFQLDCAKRGFSFMNNGPLDMRMDSTAEETAATMLARMSEDELADVIYKFGQERLSRRVARSIKRMEAEGHLNNTEDLAVAVKRVVGKSTKGHNPATRTFQAIRIAVNNELGELESLLNLLPEPLAIGGRVVIITFHSLEDRMVKKRFSKLVDSCECPHGMPVCRCPKPTAEYVTRRAVKVSNLEQQDNRRSRSAKARSLRRIR